MDKMLLSQKGSISTEDEIIIDTTISKILNFLGVLLIMTGIIIWLIILGRSEADLLDGKQILILCTLLVICIGGGIWMELKSQRHQKRRTFPEYIHDDYDYLPYDSWKEEDSEEAGDYDYLQDEEEDDLYDDTLNPDFPEEGQGKKGGTYYGNE